MSIHQKHFLVLAILILAGAILGRLAVRAAMNLLLGGTLFPILFIQINKQISKTSLVFYLLYLQSEKIKANFLI